MPRKEIVRVDLAVANPNLSPATKGRSPVAAIARNSNHLDLFVTGTDGGIYSAYWDSASDWSHQALALTVVPLPGVARS
jgi:hypothetical protein